MSQQKTSAGPVLAAMVAAAVLVVVGISFVNTQRDDDDQVFVDIEADWTSGREVDVIWRAGPHQEEVHIGPDERPHFGIRRVAARGWVIGITVTPRDSAGTISCSISINEEQQIDDQVEGPDACEVDVTV